MIVEKTVNKKFQRLRNKMGGVVTVIIKNKEKIHKMARWTNSLPFFVKHQNFFSKDQNHLESYLNEWNKMQEDFEENKDTKKFKYPMTDLYIPQSGFIAPTEYGIVFIDYDKNLLLSCQGYTDLSTYHLTSALLTYQQSQRGDKDWQEEFEAFLKLKSRFKEFYAYDKDGNKKLSKYNYLINSKNLKQDFAILDKQKNNSPEFFSTMIKLDLSPFTFKIFQDNQEGFLEIYQEIKNLLTLTSQEERLWQEYLKNRFED